jgi:allantoate deiminase
MNIAHAGVPVGMVFVRSQAGVSHAPAEFSSEDDCEAGARVLAHGAIELARRLA